jgi:NitT/TauT family transport system ATP-binding protein
VIVADPPQVASTDRAHLLRDVTYTYPGSPSPAVGSIDLDVAPGEFVCLLGPSGCGKTTLLRLVAGLLRPSGGLVQTTRADRRRPAVGWMAQRDGLLPWRSLLDNVALPLQLGAPQRAKARQRALHMLDRVGLAAGAARYPHQLSGGMRQRAALARALVSEPGLLLLDEPFAHLDELTRDELGEELIRLWAEQRPTVIMVTHSVLEAIRLADRVIVLSPGPARVVGEVQLSIARPRHETDPHVAARLALARELLRGRA